jgi:ABC-2 type transport system ATP-binding protein
MTYAVQLTGVTKRYGSFTAVDNLALSVPQGAIFGLLGPNGAGKTTTIRMINDILAPDEGTIRLLGGLPPGNEAARRIGYLPEERGLYPKMSVVDVLVFFGELRGISRKESTQRAVRWLDRLELNKWTRHKVQDLSKGMQQKVQFITAVIHEPDLLILDEPWSGLDPINAEVLLEIVAEQKRAGRTILFSTHIMDQAERLCDEVCIISRARKIAHGTVPALKREGARERQVALAFAEAEDEACAEAVLTDTSLVAWRDTRKGHIRVELAGAVTPRILLERLLAAGVNVRRFEVIEPSLHEIFVERVHASTLPVTEEDVANG